MMRLDPNLCFLTKCGPPDSEEMQENLKDSQNPDDKPMDEDEDR